MRKGIIPVLALLLLLASGCANMNRQQKGAAIGAGTLEYVLEDVRV